MTPTHPLTPTEHAAVNAALKAACAELDADRVEKIEHCQNERAAWLEDPGSLKSITAEEEYVIAHGYERAIGFLAYQLTLH